MGCTFTMHYLVILYFIKPFYFSEIPLKCTWRVDYEAVFRIRIRSDSFHFGHPDLDPFQETDPGSKNHPKLWKSFPKIQPKSQEYHILLDLLFNETDPRIRIRIKMKRI